MKQISDLYAQAGDFEISWVRSYLGTQQFGYEPVWLRSLRISFYTHSIFLL